MSTDLQPGTRVRVVPGAILDHDANDMHAGRVGTVVDDAEFDAQVPAKYAGIRPITVLLCGEPIISVHLDGEDPTRPGMPWYALYVPRALEVLPGRPCAATYGCRHPVPCAAGDCDLDYVPTSDDREGPRRA